MARALLILLACLLVPLPVAAAEPVTPSTAIQIAVESRIGSSATVVVDALVTTVRPEPGLTAIVPPDAMVGVPTRFSFLLNGQPRGFATATIRLHGRLPRAARALARGDVISGDAIVLADEEFPQIPLRRLPDPADLTGRLTRRAVSAGEPLTTTVVVVPPLVQVGSALALTVSVGTVRATSTGVAAGSGQVGDVIPVMPTQTRRTLWARIIGPGQAEVIK